MNNNKPDLPTDIVPKDFAGGCRESPLDYLHRMQTMRKQCRTAQSLQQGIEAYQHCSNTKPDPTPAVPAKKDASSS